MSGVLSALPGMPVPAYPASAATGVVTVGSSTYVLSSFKYGFSNLDATGSIASGATSFGGFAIQELYQTDGNIFIVSLSDPQSSIPSNYFYGVYFIGGGSVVGPPTDIVVASADASFARTSGRATWTWTSVTPNWTGADTGNNRSFGIVADSSEVPWA